MRKVIKMAIERIKKLSVLQHYTKEDITLSKYALNKALITLKEAENKNDSKFFYEAIELLEKSILLYPKQSEAYMALSFLFWKMNEHENALVLLKKAREFDSFNINISKQIKVINDDYIQKHKDKIIQKESANLINKLDKSNEGIISKGLNTVKSMFSSNETEKNSVPFSQKIQSNALDMNVISSMSKDNNSISKKDNLTPIENKNSEAPKNMMEALSQLKSQRENVKIKTSTGFLSRLRAV